MHKLLSLEIARHVKRISICALVLSCATLAQSQQSKIVRVPLQNHDLSIPDKVMVQVRAEFAETATSGRHTHPGEEIGYLLEGQLELKVDGQPTRILKPGDVFFIPAGVIHEGINTSSGTSKVIATYVVEKGKPVASPAN
jgi:quercetin dioxygenase-like cupin family protein